MTTFACLLRKASTARGNSSSPPAHGSAIFFPDLPLRIERQVLFWFDHASASEMFIPERCPVHLWQFDGRRFFYGFPNLGNGVKVAFHHGGEITTVDSRAAPGRG